MSKEELLEYCFYIKSQQGATYREIYNMFEKFNIKEESRKFVVQRLSDHDHQAKLVAKRWERPARKISGLVQVIIGTALFLAGYLLYKFTSSVYGAIFVFNILIFISAVIFLIRGVLLIFLSYFRKK